MILNEISTGQQILNQFAQIGWLEWLGTITGFVCIFLATRQHILNWPIAIVSSLAYAVLFYESKLYGDSALQLYFVATAGYGWYYWLKRKEEKEKPVVSLNAKGMMILLVIIIVSSAACGLVLDHFTDTNVPYVDGFCTAMSLTAQILLTRKIIQNWILWIIVDICYIPLYLYKDLFLTAILYALFLGLAVMGYVNWLKSQKTTA